MTSSSTSAVYIHVIEGVINKVRDEFINNGGPGESVLSEVNSKEFTIIYEDYNTVNTPALNDLQAATPALVARNETVDDDDDEDDDDLDDVDQEELNTQHLVLAQFDKATGEFDF